jgi:hypothetical protein
MGQRFTSNGDSESSVVKALDSIVKAQKAKKARV